MTRPYDSVLLTPTQPHGYLRRTCRNVWWLLPIAFPFVAIPAFLLRTPAAWTALALTGAAWVFAQSVADADPSESDREAFAWAACAVIALGLLCAVIVGGVVWVAS